MCRQLKSSTSCSDSAFFSEATGVLARGTPEANAVLAKTKLCKFFLRGKCKRGAACTFAHGESALQTTPDLYRTQMCYQYMETGTCRFGDRCTFAHTEEELRAPLRAVAMPVWAEWDMADSVMDASMPVCWMDETQARLITLDQYPANAEVWMKPTDSSAPSTTRSLVDEDAWSDSEFGDNSWSPSAADTVQSDEEREVDECVEMELTVQNTFITMKATGPASDAAAVVAGASTSSRRRIASEPPAARRQ